MSMSDVQIDVLRRLVAAKQPLVRRAGGVWCVADSAEDTRLPRAWQRGEWSIGLQTVRAMERRGHLARVGRLGAVSDVFDDPRVITDLGCWQVATKDDRGV
jgi:hypothetical protein